MIPPALRFVQVAGTGTVIPVSGRATRCPLDSKEKLPEAQVPAGIWLLSLGPLCRVIAFQRLVCWLSSFWRLGDKLQHRSERWQPAEGEAPQMHSGWAPTPSTQVINKALWLGKVQQSTLHSS